jgi:hypothetical protein
MGNRVSERVRDSVSCVTDLETSTRTYDDTTQGGLCVWRDRIRFVQDNNLERRIRILILFLIVYLHGIVCIVLVIISCFLLKETLRTLWFGSPYRQTSKVLDFVSNDRNATFVTSVEFENTATPLRRVPKLSTKRQSYRSLKDDIIDKTV